jgi:hypothetical protein
VSAVLDERLGVPAALEDDALGRVVGEVDSYCSDAVSSVLGAGGVGLGVTR